jgi:hypothetical protein
MQQPPPAPNPEQDAPPEESSALNRALVQLAMRIEDILEEEQSILTSQPDTFEKLVARKELLAVEAARLALAARGVVLDRHATDRLAAAGKRLHQGSRFLRRHIDAVNEIAQLVAGAVARSRSDGTYSRQAAQPNRWS